MNMSVINDPCKSTFGIMTEEINVYKNIGLTHAGGMAIAKNNGDFNTGFKKISKDGKLCANHMFI